MKLFLASEGVPRPDLLKGLLRVTEGKPRVALISNAQDPYPEVLASEREAALTAIFTSLDFDAIHIDLRKYSGKPGELKEALSVCDLLWCSGGNVFWLRYVMKESGFDGIIKDLLAEGIVYGGWSAGAVVAGPFLNPIDLMDDPNDAPEVIWEGLALIDCFIWPHWDNAKYLPLQEEASEKMKALPYESLALKDGDVIIVENGKKQLLKVSS